MMPSSIFKPFLFASMLAFAVACAPSQHDDDGTGAALPDTTSTSASQPSEHVTAQAAAEKIKTAIPDVSLITITGDNDANKMIGRSTGYVAATVIVDPRAGAVCEQAKPGIACGAGVEQWPDAAAAQQRADYIETVMGSMPMLGTEYATLRDNLLLRVSGDLSPSIADQYKAAFTA